MSLLFRGFLLSLQAEAELITVCLAVLKANVLPLRRVEYYEVPLPPPTMLLHCFLPHPLQINYSLIIQSSYAV
jgi:hypothetical protein